MGAAILIALLARVGTDPFVAGLRATDPWALLAALVVTAGTTWCCALRWSLLAERLGVAVPAGAAYRACYRAQFLNATLPAGVLGDVHRAVRHGRETGEMGRGLRSVVWDRATGQAVQAALAVAAVLVLVPGLRTETLGLVLAAAAVATVVMVGLPRRHLRALGSEARRVLGAGAGVRVAVLSAAAALGHVAVLVVAARAAGATAPLGDLLPLALVVLLASAVPLSVAGWGPREGAAAGAFAAAGLGAGAVVEVAVVYGVMALVATFPGAVALLVDRRPVAAPVLTTGMEAPRG